MPPIITLKQAVFGSATAQALVGPLDWTIEEGGKHLIEGPSGCGKTSLIRGLLGFLPLLQGEYRFQGRVLTGKAMGQLRADAGYVSQELAVGTGPVRAWLDEFLPNSLALLKASLSTFQLPATALEKSLEDLSRGERQRLIMAAVTARQPRIYFLDEVTSALNRDLHQSVMDFFAQTDATVIAIAHDPGWRERPEFTAFSLTPP